MHISLQFHVQVHLCASVPGLPLEYSLCTVGKKEEMDKLMKEREDQDEVTERRGDREGHESPKPVNETEEHVGRVDGRTTTKPKKRKQPHGVFNM